MNVPSRRVPWLPLLLGSALLVASQLRFGVGALAWLMPAAWLVYLRATSGWRSRLLFLGAFVLAWHGAIAKIVTPPLGFAAVPGFAIPIGLAHAAPYLAWAALCSRMPAQLGPPLFAAAVVLAEWVLHAVLPFGTWGSLANTQLDHPALLQLASATGLHGVSFLMAWLAAAVEAWYASRGNVPAERGAARRHALAASGAALLVVAAGQVRLAAASSGADTVRVAAVGTDATFAGLPLPGPAELERIDSALWERTRLAARSGARLVSWTEAATLVRKEDEPGWLERAQQLARTERVGLAVAYVVPVSLEPLLYENKYVLLSPRGEVLHTYLKRRPVPGEPAVAGEGPLPLAVLPEVGRVSGAICYDYDFPRLALGHARAEVDLAIVPSSDWRGIEPLHTQMAGVRAIEIGASVLRPTRLGLSAGFDPYGRLRGSLSQASEAGVLLVDLPGRRVFTLYGALGDWFPAACALLWAVALAGAVGSRAKARAGLEPGAL